MLSLGIKYSIHDLLLRSITVREPLGAIWVKPVSMTSALSVELVHHSRM